MRSWVISPPTPPPPPQTPPPPPPHALFHTEWQSVTYPKVRLSSTRHAPVSQQAKRWLGKDPLALCVSAGKPLLTTYGAELAFAAVRLDCKNIIRMKVSVTKYYLQGTSSLSVEQTTTTPESEILARPPFLRIPIFSLMLTELCCNRAVLV